MANYKGLFGRGERIRTSGPCLPKTVLYQAELLPDRAKIYAISVRQERSIGADSGDCKQGKQGFPKFPFMDTPSIKMPVFNGI